MSDRFKVGDIVALREECGDYLLFGAFKDLDGTPEVFKIQSGALYFILDKKVYIKKTEGISIEPLSGATYCKVMGEAGCAWLSELKLKERFRIIGGTK